MKVNVVMLFRSQGIVSLEINKQFQLGFDVECANCKEPFSKMIVFSTDVEIKCKNCRREGTVTIKEIKQLFKFDSDFKQVIATLEFRGCLLPVKYYMVDQVVLKSKYGSYNVTLDESEWYEYDEIDKCMVNLTEISFEIIKLG